MDTKPNTSHHALAEHYYYDAIDLIARFDLLWEIQHRKSARIKSFLDLLMACECALKALYVLRMQDTPLPAALSQVRECSHNIVKLSTNALSTGDNPAPEEVATHFGRFGVSIRYSLDAYDQFFALALTNKKPKHDYSATLGNTEWIQRARTIVQLLLDSMRKDFAGLVSDDINTIFENEIAINRALHTRSKGTKAAQR